jgi:hypothetical protein
MAFTLVTLTGQWLRSDQTPETGTVVCSLVTPLQNGNQFISAPLRIKLDANGAVSFLCPASDDIGTTPVGQTWNIYIYLSSRNEVITTVIPSSQTTVNINTQLPWGSGSSGTPGVNLGGVEIEGTPVGPNEVLTSDSSGEAEWKPVTEISGITVTGTPETGYVLVATSPTAASWQAPMGGGSDTDTAAEIEPFIYRQDAPATMAVITHNLGYNPSIVVTTMSGDEVMGDIEYLNSNVVRISFSAPFSWIATMV